MGAIAEAIAAYAQPLIDKTDGTQEQLSKAFSISQLCWNLALLPEGRRDESVSDMRSTLEMDDDEFEEFRRSVVVPMIRRHEEMFPQLHRLGSTDPPRIGRPRIGPSPLAQPRTAAPFAIDDALARAIAPLPLAQARTAARAEKYPGTGRYEPCPCNSGRKYKFCCGQKGR